MAFLNFISNQSTIQEIPSKSRLENTISYWHLLTAVQIWNKELTINDQRT